MQGGIVESKDTDVYRVPNPVVVLLELEKALFSILVDLNLAMSVRIDLSLSPLERVVKMEKEVQMLEALARERKDKEHDEIMAVIKAEMVKVKETRDQFPEGATTKQLLVEKVDKWTLKTDAFVKAKAALKSVGLELDQLCKDLPPSFDWVTDYLTEVRETEVRLEKAREDCERTFWELLEAVSMDSRFNLGLPMVWHTFQIGGCVGPFSESVLSLFRPFGIDFPKKFSDSGRMSSLRLICPLSPISLVTLDLFHTIEDTHRQPFAFDAFLLFFTLDPLHYTISLLEAQQALSKLKALNPNKSCKFFLVGLGLKQYQPSTSSPIGSDFWKKWSQENGIEKIFYVKEEKYSSSHSFLNSLTSDIIASSAKK
jgi:hypothetical protein